MIQVIRELTAQEIRDELGEHLVFCKPGHNGGWVGSIWDVKRRAAGIHTDTIHPARGATEEACLAILYETVRNLPRYASPYWTQEERAINDALEWTG